MEPDGLQRIRFLFQCEPQGGSSALEPGQRAAHRRILQAGDFDAEWLRRPGSKPLFRHGPAQRLLMPKIPTPRENLMRPLKVTVFLLCLGPVGVLIWKFFHELLGANPVDVITRSTGRWTLTFLLITLGITPLRRLAGMPWLVRFRRMLGLYAFFYGCLHLTTYVWMDKFFDVHEMLQDILTRRFITAGMTGWLLM